MDHYYMLPPTKQKYWQIIAVPLQSLGLGFSHWWGYPKQPKICAVLHFVIVALSPVCVLSQILHFYGHFSDYDFIEIVDHFGVIMGSVMVVVRVSSALRAIYKKVLIDFMEVIHIYNYEPRNTIINQLLIKCCRYERYIGWTIITIMFVNNLLWVFDPITANFSSGAYYSNGTIKLKSLFHMIMPFDYEYNINYWLVVQIIGIYLGAFGSAIIGLFDIITLCIINHLIGRLKILNIHFKDLAEKFDEYTDEEVAERLAICIRDHVRILRIFQDMQGSHGVAITAQYGYNLIFDALLFIEFQYGNLGSKARYGLVGVMFIGGLYGMSLIMEQIRIQSDELSNTLYFVPWERMGMSNRKTFLIFLGRIQPILVFKAFAGLEAGIRPTINIMKSTFSYYVMFTSSSSLDKK